MEEQNNDYSYNPYQQPQMNTQQSFHAGNGYSYGGGAVPPNKPKKEKKHGFGVTLAKCAAIALVFGLVAGTSFTGVEYIGSRLFETEEEQEPSGSQKKDNEQQDTVFNQTTDGGLQQTATGSSAAVTDVSGIVDAVMPSIVSITNTGTVTYQSFWGQVQSVPSESCGSGIIIAQDAQYLYIATNNHVVASADTLTVQFADGKTVSSEIKGTDPSDDLAVVQVALSGIDSDTLEQIKVASIGDSTQLKVGQASIAIGNALGYGQSVTTGVISALGRTVTVSDQSAGTTITNYNLIQTDAAINPGNSGGALLNTSGEVIGINSVKYADTDVEGIGYAIPISDAMEIIEQLIQNGKVEEKQNAYLGIQGQDVSSNVSQAYGIPEGIYVYRVISGSGAEKAGLLQGDIITEVDGRSVGTMNELKQLLQKEYEPGDQITIRFYRMNNGYQQMELSVTLGGSGTTEQ